MPEHFQRLFILGPYINDVLSGATVYVIWATFYVVRSGQINIPQVTLGLKKLIICEKWSYFKLIRLHVLITQVCICSSVFPRPFLPGESRAW